MVNGRHTLHTTNYHHTHHRLRMPGRRPHAAGLSARSPYPPFAITSCTRNLMRYSRGNQFRRWVRPLRPFPLCAWSGVAFSHHQSRLGFGACNFMEFCPESGTKRIFGTRLCLFVLVLMLSSCWNAGTAWPYVCDDTIPRDVLMVRHVVGIGTYGPRIQ
jgi:hypothetical protein